MNVGSVAVGVLKAAAAIFFSRILGFLREVLTAYFFGVGASTDAFFLAWKIPNIFRRVLGEGVLEKVFIPYLHGDANGSFRRSVLGYLLLFSAAVWLLIFTFADAVVGLLAGENEAFSSQAAFYLKILSLYLFFAFLNAYFSALLVYKGVFFKSYFSQAIFNLTVIASVLLFHKGWGILSLVWGAVFGGTLQVFYILLVSKREGVFTLPSFEFNEKLKGFFKNLLPSFGSVGIGQLTTLAEAFLAAAAGAGVLSSLYYAFRLYQLPFGLVGVAVSRVALTDMAASTSERALIGKLVKASEMALFFAVPAALYLSLGAEPIIKTVYARGAFGETDAGRTALYLSLYALGLPFAVLHSVLGNLFFVRKSFYTFFLLSLPWFLTEVVGGFLGVFVLKLGGGALAFSYALGALISFLAACFSLGVCRPMVGALRGMGKFLPLWGFSAFVLIFSRDLNPLPFLVETFAGAAVYLWLFYRLYIKRG